MRVDQRQRLAIHRELSEGGDALFVSGSPDQRDHSMLKDASTSKNRVALLPGHELGLGRIEAVLHPQVDRDVSGLISKAGSNHVAVHFLEAQHVCVQVLTRL